MFEPITVEITDEMRSKAKARGNNAYNNTSFMKGKGNFVGFLGEYMVEDLIPQFEHVDKFSHDFEYNGLKIEVKTKTQNVSKTPEGYYEASIAMASLHQNPDYYIFCRAYKDGADYLYGWVLGGISRKALLKNGRSLKKGQKDGNNGYVCQNDCINIRYDQLAPIKVKL